MELLYKDKVFFSWFSHWKQKSFTLGLSLASERNYIIADGDYSVLNSDDTYDFTVKREYYLLLNLGFWQLSIGVNI